MIFNKKFTTGTIIVVILISLVYSDKFFPVLKGLTQDSPFDRITTSPSPFDRITATPVNDPFAVTGRPRTPEATRRDPLTMFRDSVMGTQEPGDLSQRRQTDQQTLQEEGQAIEQLQEQDRQQCKDQMGMGGGGLPGGDMGMAVNDGVSQIAQQTLNENLPDELQRQIQQTLPDQLNQQIQEGFGQQLSQSIQEDLRSRLPEALNQASQGGSVTITEDMFRGIFEDTFRTSFNEQAPQALSRSITESFPNALQESIRLALPQSVENIMTNDLPFNIQDQLPSILRTNLEEPVTNSLLDQNLPDLIRQDLQGGISNFGDGGFFSGIIDTFRIGQFADQNNQMDDLAIQLTRQVSDDLVREISDNLMIGVNQEMDNIINSMTSSFDSQINQLFNAGFAPLDQAINDLIPQMTGSLDLILQQNINQFTGIFDQAIGGILDPLTGSFDQIIGGVLDPVTGALSGITDSIMNPLTGALDGLTSGLLDPLTGSFDQIIGGVLDPVTGALSGITDSIMNPLTGALDGLTSGLLDPVTGALSGITDSIMSPVTGALSGITDSIMSPVTGALTGITDSIISPVTDAIGGITENVVGGITDTVAGTVTDGVAGAVSETVGGAVTETVGKVAGDVVGGAATNLIGGIMPFGFGAVPVKEVNGPLLSTTKKIEKNTKEIDKTTKEIDKTTKSMEELLVEICTYQKSIQRIQTAAEQREVVEKAELRRQAASDSEQYRQDFADIVQRGYKYGDNQEGPLFVSNTQGYINDILQPETFLIFEDQLLNSSADEFKQETANRLRKLNEIDSMPKSTITKDQYNKFKSGQIDDPEDWWKTLLAVNNPFYANNPISSYRLNESALAQRMVLDEQNFRDEMIAGQGFLPIRECAQYTSDGQTCVRWEVITPAIQVQETAASVFNYRAELYTSPEPGDVAPGNEPTIEELRTFRPVTTGGGGSGGGGGGAAGFDIGALLGMLSSLQQNQNFQQSNLSFNFTLPTASQVERGVANIARLNWQTTGVNNCVASNNWLSGASTVSNNVRYNFNQIVRPQGQSLGVDNSLNINLPIGAEALLLRDRSIDEPSLRTVTGAKRSQVDEKGLTSSTIITLPEDILVGDTFAITLWPFSLNNSVSVTVTEGRNTKRQLLEDLRTAISEARNSQNAAAFRPEFQLYNFAYNAAAGAEAIRITPKLDYKITCTTTDNKTLNEQITLTR